MTSELNIWLNDAPVIPTGNAEFSIWFMDVPVIDLGASGGGGGLFGGSRIVSPRQQRRRNIDFSSDPFHLRTVSPRVEIGRSPQ